MGPAPKRARTPKDYPASTLKKIVAIDAQVDRLPRENRYSPYSDLLAFKVSVRYTGLSRPISRKSNEALLRWVRCCAGNPDHFLKNYVTEIRFAEHGRMYWLAVPRSSLPAFGKLKKGQMIKLLLIRVADRLREENRGSVLLVEKFSESQEDWQTF